VYARVKDEANAAARKVKDAERNAREFEIAGKVKAARRKGK